MPAVRIADLGAKVLLVALLLVALAFPDLSGMKARGAGARLVVYPLGVLAVPVWWYLWRRPRGLPFPWVADLLVTSPWAIDLLGNRLNLFDTVGWWDDLMHVVNWLLLTAGVVVAWRPGPRTGGGTVVMVALGFGTTAALIWELGEYVWFIRQWPDPNIVYRDTLGDLTLGTLGALLAGVLIARVRRRARAGKGETGPGAVG
ncbi:MAG: hypothetical protein ACLGIF_08835 [Actinomycetes bacterium]